ncbi:hypothetical protein BGZ63DRAFT_385337 [Mariannaea sp. PMI_226]|nr:hypothetical protein BGZ63DRAFT_385337 [Mariannaea sp. PMI_226]
MLLEGVVLNSEFMCQWCGDANWRDARARVEPGAEKEGEALSIQDNLANSNSGDSGGRRLIKPGERGSAGSILLVEKG